MNEDPRDYRFRTRFNQHMHSALATRYHRLVTGSAIVSALASSTGLAAFLGDSSPVGTVLIGLAIVSAAVSPVLGWSAKHAKHSSLFSGYRMLELRMPMISAEEVKQQYRDLEYQEPAEKPALFERLRGAADATSRQELGYA